MVCSSAEYEYVSGVKQAQRGCYLRGGMETKEYREICWVLSAVLLKKFVTLMSKQSYKKHTVKTNKKAFKSAHWMVEILVAILLLFCCVNTSFGEEGKIDVNALIQETQRTRQTDNEMILVWWIPLDYWRISFEQNPNMTAAQRESFLDVLRPYILVMAVDSKMGMFGGFTFEPEATLLDNIELVDRAGVQYRPLRSDMIDADIKNLLSMMKPVMANMFGPLGQNMHFVLFPAKNKKGQDIALPDREGALTIRIRNNEFKWRLPLGSVVPPKACPADGEKLNGAWKFCPWHGLKLQ